MRGGLLALVTVLALSACAGTPKGPAATPGPTQTGSCVRTAPVASVPSPGGTSAPDLALACFTSAATVSLARLGRPAVVNLWASWCPPCRLELPQFEAFAKRAGDTVLVIGVATDTARAAAQSIVDDLGLTFPMLYDREKRLLLAIERVNLPVTLFVDAQGRVAHVYNSTPLDGAALERLAQQYLGVVTPT
jgi:thiol-disulfide isomerase/thioredoxin